MMRTSSEAVDRNTQNTAGCSFQPIKVNVMRSMSLFQPRPFVIRHIVESIEVSNKRLTELWDDFIRMPLP